MDNKITPVIKRGARMGLDTIVATIVAQTTGDPRWLALAPLLAAIGKFLRCTLGLKYIPF